MLKVIKYGLRVSKEKKLSLELVKEIRNQLDQQMHKTYSINQRQHTDRVYEQRLYGRNCYVVGITPDSLESTSYIKSVFSSLKPTHVILGGFNNTRLISERIARTMSQIRSVRVYDNYVEANKMFCKTLVTPMIIKILNQDPNYSRDQDLDDSICRYDHNNKHIWYSNYMTIMDRAIFKEFSKLSLGLPSDYIVFEDIMINQSLESLRQVYNRVIDTCVASKDEHGLPIKNVQFYPDLVCEEVRYTALNEPVLTKKQLTYTTALLHRYASVFEKTAIFVDNRFVHQVAQNVHKISMDPKDVYRGGYANNLNQFIKNSSNSEIGAKLHGYLNAEDKNKAIDELLQKFAILSILKHDTLQKQLVKDQHNIFKKTVFNSLFSQLPIAQIIERYKNIKKGYRHKYGEIIEERVRNTLTYEEPQKDFYTLTEMICTQEQRNQDFPVLMEVRTLASIHKQKKDLKQIQNYVKEMIKKQLPPTEQQMIENHKKGLITRQSIVLYQKLFVEAKIRLNKINIKLPVHHYSALSAIFKDQIKNNILLQSNKFKTEPTEQPHTAFQKKLNELMKKGIVRQITEKEEIEMFTNDQIPRISLDFDERGQPTFHHDCRTPQQMKNLVENWQNDEMFRDMVEMTEKAQKSGKQEVYYQEGFPEGNQRKKSTNKVGGVLKRRRAK